MTIDRPVIIAAFAAALLAGCQDAGQQSVAALSPGATFTVAAIDGAPAPEGVTLEVGEGGRVSGRGPCNRYSGQLTEQDGAMAISGVVSTRMACLDPVRGMAETRFNAALGVVTGATPTADGVSLIDAEGRERVRLQRMQGA